MKRVNRIYLLGLFAVMLVFPVLNTCFHFVHFERKDENRTFHDSLSLNFAKLDKFPKDCEAYVNDNFVFRSPLIAADKYLQFYWFRVSPDPNQLLLGRHGRYFVAGPEKKIYEGDLNFTPQQLDSFAFEWTKRKHYFDSLGIVVYLVPGPSALEIYPEDLPIHIRKRYPFTRIDQLKQRFRGPLSGIILDPTQALLAAKDQGNLYFMLDHHWNNRAGYVVSELVLQQLKKKNAPELDLSFLKEYSWKTETCSTGHIMNLLRISHLREEVPVIDPRYREKAVLAPNYPLSFVTQNVSAEQQQFHFVNKSAKNKLKVLIIRDSFGNAVYPFLKEAFAETVVIFDGWTYRLNKSVMETYRPDIVIYLSYDPHLESYIAPKNRE